MPAPTFKVKTLALLLCHPPVVAIYSSKSGSIWHLLCTRCRAIENLVLGFLESAKWIHHRLRNWSSPFLCLHACGLPFVQIPSYWLLSHLELYRDGKLTQRCQHLSGSEMPRTVCCILAVVSAVQYGRSCVCLLVPDHYASAAPHG